MSFKSTIAHLLNDLAELVHRPWVEGYVINSGVDHGLSQTYYGERLVELPLLFRWIRTAPARVLDVGCSESITPIQLAMLDYRVTGVDIMNYRYTHKNFTFFRGSLLEYKPSEKFDIVIDISAIEHFGLGAYRNAKLDADADKRAVKKIEEMLAHNGQFIFSAPYGVHGVVNNFERIYDWKDVTTLLQGFRIKEKVFYEVNAHSQIRKITQTEASRIKYDYQRYGVIVINAERT